MITLGNLTQFQHGNACVGKKGFENYAEAEVEIGRLIRKKADRPEQGTLHAYLCDLCLKYHLGHFRPAPEPKKRKRR